MFAAAASAASTTQVSDAVTSAQPISNHVITSSAVLNANMAEPAVSFGVLVNIFLLQHVRLKPVVIELQYALDQLYFLFVASFDHWY